MKAAALIAMRLVDMTRVHPSQDNTRRCRRCDQRVGIYPSGQRALRRDPDLEIVCSVCLQPGFGDSIPAADTFMELIAEARDSTRVKKT